MTAHQQPEIDTELLEENERLRAIALELHARLEAYSTTMKEIAEQTNDFLVKMRINQLLSGDK